EGETGLAAVLLDDVQRGPVVAVGDHVEPVQRPVEAFGPRPGEALVGGGVVLAVLQQEVPRAAEQLGRRRHWLSSYVPDHCRAALWHRLIRDAGLTTPERGCGPHVRGSSPHVSRAEGAMRWQQRPWRRWRYAARWPGCGARRGFPSPSAAWWSPAGRGSAS